jgi:hypothetical protein
MVKAHGGRAGFVCVGRKEKLTDANDGRSSEDAVASSSFIFEVEDTPMPPSRPVPARVSE